MLCIGCMSFGVVGSMHDQTSSESDTHNMADHVLSLGTNFIDTANCYSKGSSEVFLGIALKNAFNNHLSSRDEVVIASKVYFNEGRLSASAIKREIDGTLKRLGTDYLDLYIIHRFDYETPIEQPHHQVPQ